MHETTLPLQRYLTALHTRVREPHRRATSPPTFRNSPRPIRPGSGSASSLPTATRTPSATPIARSRFNRYRNRWSMRRRWPIADASAVLQKVGVEPSGEAFNSISLDPQSGAPLNPMINAGAIATTGLVAGATAAAQWKRIADVMARVLRSRDRRRRRGLPVRKRDRIPQPRDRLAAQELRHHRRRSDADPRELFPAVLGQRHLPRPRVHGGDVREQRRASGHRQARRSGRGCRGRAEHHGDLRHVRLRGQLAVRRRPAGEERRQRRRDRRDARALRHRRLLAAARRERQQRAWTRRLPADLARLSICTRSACRSPPRSS